MLFQEIIKKKRSGLELSESEINQVITTYTSGETPDYQMSALAMAVYFKGMTPKETAHLTKAMIKSGEALNFDEANNFVVDKHSTGGVGDKTSLVLAPIVASFGAYVPMISGRGLGHTGGTLDKLESIPGMRVFLPLNEAKSLVLKNHLSFLGQSEQICPADKKLYALRDVTATVESLPLICASIMSKKIAEGINHLTLDVKFGSGAFMKTIDEARQLAEALIAIGKESGLKVNAALTSMEQPLGRFIGNSLEVSECYSILKGEKDDLGYFEETRELSLQLSALMISIGTGMNSDDAYAAALEELSSGRALQKFETVIQNQKGRLNEIPVARKIIEVRAKQTGTISSFHTESIGYAAVQLGAGRRIVTDKIDPSVGIEMLCKIGDQIELDQPLFKLHINNERLCSEVSERLLSSVRFDTKTSEFRWIVETL